MTETLHTAQANGTLKQSCAYKVGLDAGSTTLKLVITDNSGKILFSDYNRHHANIPLALSLSLEKAMSEFGDIDVSIAVTGSAGMGLAERYNIPFVQEVVAATIVIDKKYPDVKTLVDIGGEDSKMIFFNQNRQADIRMNGNCAGGTGAFIDQMAAILGVTPSALGQLALNADTVYPIASRCGVFSKTDIQNLISLNVKRENIAASIFHAVSTQVISTLSRGCDIQPKIFLCGGPLTFIPALRNAFKEKLKINDEDLVFSENAAVIPAWGASLSSECEEIETRKISECIVKFKEKKVIQRAPSGLKPLFKNEQEFSKWEKEKALHKIEKIDLKQLKNENCYIGIDSGSTTTKIVAINEDDHIFFTFYKKNGGKSLETVKEGLTLLCKEAKEAGKKLLVKASCSTGYGEDLIKTAFGLSYGMVETIAHYTAAYKLNPQVSFILDIGGQDMKAIFVEDGAINRLEINEACSSGCGSFIDNFATSLECTIGDFVEKACRSSNPADLGTRCTVFMNSKVKQCLRENASVEDISAGLAYSVIKNCLYKVLKLKDTKELGDHIILQGGTMRNKAVVRAFEQLIGKTVIVSNYPELMGAYGAALHAKKRSNNQPVGALLLDTLADIKDYETEQMRCVGCENNCQILKNIFGDGKIFYSGNKCEKVYTNKGEKGRMAFNMSLFRYELAFKKNIRLDENQKPFCSIGIPRALNMHENFQFWHTLLTLNNIEVITSSRSTFRMYEKGLNTVMADNICFPAKITHGHIFDLIDKKADRILFPYVIYEQIEPQSNNSYNCPIVSGYSDVIRSSINPEGKYGIPLDAPVINFNDKGLLKKACKQYLKTVLGDCFTENNFNVSFKAALDAKAKYEQTLHKKAVHILEKAKEENRFIILLAGRPYHNDQLIQHKISEIITSFGVDVITEDLLRGSDKKIEDSHLIPQWSYMNRIMKAAQWVANSDEHVYFVQITSFGCGPDSFITDELSDLLHRNGKTYTVLKVDDVNNAGSLKLRIRSLIESLKFKDETEHKEQEFQTTPKFLEKDQDKRILVPFFSEFHSPFIPACFELMGCKMENMEPSDKKSAELGLKYANNEICYPATLIVGDCIRALQSGKYDNNNLAFAITQTGGQCRATNYIALIKKALITAGYDNIPVISVSIMNTINDQPGFNLNVKNGAKTTIYALLYGDAISKMYYSAVVREKSPGIADKLKKEYLDKAIPCIEKKDITKLLKTLEEAATKFNEATTDKKAPRVGIVGEIFIKYNSFGHQHVVDWLIKQGIEPVIPPLIEFFTQYFPNAKFNESCFLNESRSIKEKLFTLIGENMMNRIERKIDKAASKYRYYEGFENIHDAAKSAEKIISLAAQFGEGWLIPAEFASFAERGINFAISLQPFGCIANHIISKGIEKRVKDTYPNMNLLFLDFDSGVSEVNVLNRLHFLAKQAKEELNKQ
ncbi:MAG TPA: acyl-CoA dehydratase activase [Paludibacteraceae bacterium]|nr:acyl-CoA dehydratase activase [Paludibacteraceae bacterium]HPH62542.1 acyl-CoA dehydratase activase [Paludibacteraceae bacterium]